MSSRALARFLAHGAGAVSAVILLVLVVAALAAPLLADAMGHDPFTPDLFNRFQPASAAHPLGTDELGRDLLLASGLVANGRVDGTDVAQRLPVGELVDRAQPLTRTREMPCPPAPMPLHERVGRHAMEHALERARRLRRGHWNSSGMSPLISPCVSVCRPSARMALIRTVAGCLPLVGM